MRMLMWPVRSPDSGVLVFLELCCERAAGVWSDSMCESGKLIPTLWEISLYYFLVTLSCQFILHLCNTLTGSHDCIMYCHTAQEADCHVEQDIKCIYG